MVIVESTGVLVGNGCPSVIPSQDIGHLGKPCFDRRQPKSRLSVVRSVQSIHPTIECIRIDHWWYWDRFHSERRFYSNWSFHRIRSSYSMKKKAARDRAHVCRVLLLDHRYRHPMQQYRHRPCPGNKPIDFHGFDPENRPTEYCEDSWYWWGNWTCQSRRF